MATKDYNVIKWDNYLYLDETSPSGLRWKVDRRCGNGIINASAGSVAGFLYKTGKRIFPRWRLVFEGKFYMVCRIMFILTNGSIDSKLVVDHLDGDTSNNTISNLCLKNQRANLQNCKMRENNKSGITGVSLLSTVRGSKIYKSWVAVWRDTNRRQRTKTFSVIKFGHDEAFALAVAHRHEQIKLLNESGSSYTNRHLENNERKANESS